MYAVCSWARVRNTFYAEQPGFNSHAGINASPCFFNKLGNQVKLQIHAISECIKRSSISFGLILVSLILVTDLINTLKAVNNSFEVAASLIQRKCFYSNSCAVASPHT